MGGVPRNSDEPVTGGAPATNVKKNQQQTNNNTLRPTF